MAVTGQGNLFPVDASGSQREGAAAFTPLAARMRPRTLEEIVGQGHLLGENALLVRLVRGNRFGSLILSGPPGCGKTTLARVVASESGGRFVRVNAVSSNVTELREYLAEARFHRDAGTILFIDELHRFNKAQQDLLLPDLEEGTVRLIGATTYNPGFYVIPALLSRSHLFRLEPVGPAEIEGVLRRAVEDVERGLGGFRVAVGSEVIARLARYADGDLRRGLNALETLVLAAPMGGEVTAGDVQCFFRERQIRYDRGEDEHYDTISAFIKSVRGGDPDAAIYWLAKMLLGGEDPRFIARRLVILASEDIGLADSRGLPVAVACFQACEVVGLPECELHLAHATLFLATSPKSNSACVALAAAKKDIRENGLQEVPVWLRDGHGKASREAGHGQGYAYSHDFPEAISGQEYLAKPVSLYKPTGNGSESSIRERLDRWRALKEALGKGDGG